MSANNKKTANLGFTLVELSIVIVIIGFLVAGIAAGSNMVKQAQLRSVITDIQSHQTAYNGFIGRYGKVPGDMDVAFAYWGTSCATDAGDCNGDGNGIILPATDDTDEVATAWRHLGLAGFLNGGNAVVPAAPAQLVTGVNAPASKISGAGFTMAGTLDLTRGLDGAAIGFGGGATNYLYLGRTTANIPVNTLNLVAASLKAEDGYNLDVKMDDGIVDGSGNFVGGSTGYFRAYAGSALNWGTDCTTATSYVMSETDDRCIIGYALN